MNRREKIEQVIWDNVDTSGGENACWPWKGQKSPDGYGVAVIGDKRYRAHRLVYETLVEPIPDNAMICHHCDRPECTNPGHLFLGNAEDNARDMIIKGRSGAKENFTPQPVKLYPTVPFERHTVHKLRDKKIRKKSMPVNKGWQIVDDD